MDQAAEMGRRLPGASVRDPTIFLSIRTGPSLLHSPMLLLVYGSWIISELGMAKVADI